MIHEIVEINHNEPSMENILLGILTATTIIYFILTIVLVIIKKPETIGDFFNDIVFNDDYILNFLLGWLLIIIYGLWLLCFIGYEISKLF